MKNHHITVLQIALLLIISIISVTVAVKEQNQQVNAGYECAKTIILDAGHGGLTNTID